MNNPGTKAAGPSLPDLNTDPNQTNTPMKSILAIAIAIAAASVTLLPAPAEASNRYRSGYSAAVCKPHFVCTRVLSRHYECRWAKDHCGRRYSYRVLVTTYADVYSNGSYRTYTRVVRG